MSMANSATVTTTRRDEPAMVKDLSDVLVIAAGVAHALAIRSDGSVWAWGSHIGTRGRLVIPAKVPDLEGVVAVAGGFDHSLIERPVRLASS